MSSGKRLNTLSFVLGAAAGAGLMALIDPGRGSWRRNQIRQKAVRGVHVAGREGRKRWQRAVDNFRGGLAETRAKIRDSRRTIPDDQLYDRVRAQLGHVVRHLGELEIAVNDGEVHVRGPILRGERERICHRLDGTRGVRNYLVDVEEVAEGEMQRRTG